MDLRADSLQELLRLSRFHFPVLDQPAEYERGASSAPGLAMNVHGLPAGDLVGDETDAPLYVFQGGWREIDRGNAELFDAKLPVGLHGSRMFPAHVDDSADTQFGQPGNIGGEGERAQDEMRIDGIPPGILPDESVPENVPGQRGQEEDFRYDGFHGIPGRISEVSSPGNAIFVSISLSDPACG